MKLKKLLAVLLALALAMTCLVSCSKDEDTEDKKESKRISAEQPPKEDPDEGLEEPIENIVEFYETADGECIFDAFPDVLVEQLSGEEEEEILSMVDEYKSYVEMADSMKVDYKIVSKEPIPEEELKSFQADLEEMVSGEKAEVTAGYLCTVEIDITVEAAGEKESNSQEMEMNLYKVNDEWAIDPSSL